MKNEKVILAEGCVYSTDTNETQLNNNIIVCGGSGSGKTMSVSEPRLLQTTDTSLVITLSKRRLVNKYKSLFEERGYNVWDLNFVQPDKSTVAYDPMKYVRSYSDVTFLAESIVKSNGKNTMSSDPYWDEAATSLLSAEIAYIMMTKKQPSFADVLELHEKIDFEEKHGMLITTLDDKFKKLEETDPSCFAISCWKSFHKLPVKTASCVFGVLNTMLDTLFSPELRSMMRTKQKIKFEQMATERTILFVSTSAVNPTMNTFVNMFYAQVFKSLFEYAENRDDGILPIPVHVLCDDFATGSKIHNFPEYISIFREKRISVTLLLQSESQLEAMYGEGDATTIINNCDTYLFMGGNDLKTARSMSIRLNAPLEDVLYMPIGEVVVFRRGQRPVVTKRYNILENELYKEVTERYENGIVEKVA